MEKDSMFTDREIRYCQYVCSHNLIYKFNTILTKIQASYFMDISKLILEKQRTQSIKGEEQSQKSTTTQLQDLL